jgi:hypothetical protein
MTLWLALAACRGVEPAAPAGDDVVAVLHSSRMEGELEPCG